MILITRPEWGALEPHVPRSGPDRYDGVEVHHTASPSAAQVLGRSAIKVMQGLQEWMMRPKVAGGKGWNDLFYNLVVFPDGTVFQGRFDTPNGMLRVCFVGNFLHEKPTAAQKQVLLTLVGVHPGKLDTHTWRAAGTRFASQCPGDNMIELVTAILEGTIGDDDMVANPTAFVTSLYGAVLGGTPDEPGLNYWVQRIEGGLTAVEVLVFFMDVDRKAREQVEKDLIAKLGNNFVTSATTERNSYEGFLHNLREYREQELAEWPEA